MSFFFYLFYWMKYYLLFLFYTWLILLILFFCIDQSINHFIFSIEFFSQQKTNVSFSLSSFSILEFIFLSVLLHWWWHLWHLDMNGNKIIISPFQNDNAISTECIEALHQRNVDHFLSSKKKKTKNYKCNRFLLYQF